MKTIERIAFPVIVTRDGNAAARHERADIVFTHGAPAYVRAQEPFAIYPWEVVRQINRTSDEVGPWLDTGSKVDDPDLTARLRDSVAAIAEERNGAKQEARQVRDLLISTVLRVSEALGRAAPDSRDPDTAVELARDVAKLRDEVARLRNLHTEHRLALRAAMGLRDDEANDNATGDFKALCKRVSSQRKSCELVYRTACINSDDARRLSKTVNRLQRDLTSVTEQRDVLRRQLEELRADMRKPTKPNGTVLFQRGEQQAAAFREDNPPDTEHQQAQNRDKWRATCLANGAKDCTVYFGPGDEVTFVVELKDGASLDDLKDVLCGSYGFDSTNCKIREVRPQVDPYAEHDHAEYKARYRKG